MLYADYNDTLVLGSGDMKSLARVFEIFRELTELPVVSQGSGPQRFRADISPLQRVIDWQPRILIEEGIRRTWKFGKTRRAK